MNEITSVQCQWALFHSANILDNKAVLSSVFFADTCFCFPCIRSTPSLLLALPELEYIFINLYRLWLCDWVFDALVQGTEGMCLLLFRWLRGNWHFCRNCLGKVLDIWRTIYEGFVCLDLLFCFFILNLALYFNIQCFHKNWLTLKSCRALKTSRFSVQ